MKAHRIFIIALAALLFSSCKNKIQGEFWGETNYYSNFPFKKYKPIIMEQTLVLEFNDDAQQYIEGDIELVVVERETTGQLVPINEKEIILYKNGEQCINNILKVKTSENEVVLGIEFTKDARKGYYTLYLSEKGQGALDRIDYQNLTSGFCIVKHEVWNPLAKILFWILVVIVAFLIVWRIFIRPLMFDFFRITNLYLFYPNEMKTLKIRGCLKIVCSNKKQSQSFVNKFFTGRIIFVQNMFWESDFVIVPRNKKSVRIRPQRLYSVMPSNTVNIGEDTEIRNNNTNEITKLSIN